MTKIVINGKAVMVEGNNISIINGKVFVDGVTVDTGETLSGIVSVRFEGDLAKLKCDGKAEVTGNVTGDVSAGGSVSCGAVGGNVDAGGKVICGDVTGTVKAGGSVSYGMK